MEERKQKRHTNKKVNTTKKVNNKKTTKTKGKSNKTKVKPIIIVDYTFLISLTLSIIFGVQTNPAFLLPFTITLIITLVCMGIILVNAIYSKIKKKIRNIEK